MTTSINPAFLIEGAAVIRGGGGLSDILPWAASTFIWLVISVTVETIKKNRRGE